jgi:hypothetical protein
MLFRHLHHTRPYRVQRSFTFVRSVRAQMNSVASIARPSGIATTAGPGNTIMATPIIKTVKPATITIRRLARPYVLMMRCFTMQSLRRDFAVEIHVNLVVGMPPSVS